MERSLSQTAEYDLGLRSFMLSVYNRIGAGIFLTGIMAWLAANTALRDLLFEGAGKQAHYTLIGSIVCWAPIVLLLGVGMARGLAEEGGSAVAYWGTCLLFGLSFGTIFLRYSGIAISTAFAETALAFGALSLYGYVTKQDLSGLGVFFLVALFGLIIALIASVFIHSSAFNLLLNIAGILIFSGLVAYNTQQMKDQYEPGEDNSAAANMAALSLYLDFINLFQFFLAIGGGGDDD